MMRTTVVGSWPPEERYRAPLALYFSGQTDQSESETLLREVAAVAIAQQQACGLDEYTGGETSADSFILHLPRLLTGIEPTDQLDAWGGRGSYFITGPLGAPRGLGVAAAFRRERAIDSRVTNITIPGTRPIGSWSTSRSSHSGKRRQPDGGTRQAKRGAVSARSRRRVELEIDQSWANGGCKWSTK